MSCCSLQLPPACRKRRLKGGVRGSLVATSAAARCQGPIEVLPRPGQKFGSSFLLHAHRCSASETTTSGTRASPKPGNSPKSEQVKGRPNGWRYVGRKEETRSKFNGR